MLRQLKLVAMTGVLLAGCANVQRQDELPEVLSQAKPASDQQVMVARMVPRGGRETVVEVGVYLKQKPWFCPVGAKPGDAEAFDAYVNSRKWPIWRASPPKDHGVVSIAEDQCDDRRVALRILPVDGRVEELVRLTVGQSDKVVLKSGEIMVVNWK